MATNQMREMSKEEKEAALDKKMEEMRRKNAEREKRYALVQADLARAKEAGNYVEMKASSTTSPTAVMTENPLAGVQQEQKRPVGRGRGRASLKPKVDTQAPPPGPVGFLDDPRREGPLPNQDTGPRRHPRNFGGHSFADVKNEMRNRPGPSSRPNSHGLPTAKEMEATMTGRERLERQQWMEERQRADEARLARQRSGQGEGWRREWDKGKTQINDDVPLPPASHRTEQGQRPEGRIGSGRFTVKANAQEYDQQQQRYYHDNGGRSRNQTHYQPADRDYEYHENRRKPPRQRLGEFMPQQQQWQGQGQGQRVDNNGEGEVRRRPVKERLGPFVPQPAEDSPPAHGASGGGQGQRNRRQSDREQFEDATAQPGGNRKAALNKERQDKHSEVSQDQQQRAATATRGEVHHFNAKPQRVNKPPPRAQRLKQQQVAGAVEGGDQGGVDDAGQDDGAKKRKQHTADTSPKSAQVERKVHDRGDAAKVKSDGTAKTADDIPRESVEGDIAESLKNNISAGGSANKRAVGFKVGKGGSYGKARRPPRARPGPKSKAAVGGKASVSSTGDEGDASEKAGEDDGEGHSEDGKPLPPNDATAAAAADEDEDIDDEALKQFVEDHMLKLDVQIAAMGSLSLVDGSVTSPETTMKTPVGHIHVPDWSAAVDDADKSDKRSSSVSSSKDLAERQTSAEPTKEEVKNLPPSTEDVADSTEKMEAVVCKVENNTEVSAAPCDSKNEAENNSREVVTPKTDGEEDCAGSAATAAGSNQPTSGNTDATTAVSNADSHLNESGNSHAEEATVESQQAAEDGAQNENQEEHKAAGDEALNKSQEEHKAAGDEAQNESQEEHKVHSSPAHKTPSSEDHSDDTGSSDTFVLADEGSASPDRQLADRASSV